MEEGPTAQNQLLNAFPEELHNKAKARACFGGEFDFERFKLSVNKRDNIDISCSFYFADKQKNSFFSITERLL